MRHIHTTVGAVVSWHTFQRGNGCLTRSNVSWRVGARKSRRKSTSAGPSPIEPSKFRCKLKRHTTETLLRKRYLRERTFKYRRKSNRRIWTGRRLVRVKPWIVRRGSYSIPGYWDLEWIEVCRADVTKVLCVAKEQDENTGHASSETPATSTSRPALESQEMPVGPGPRSTAGPRKPGAAGPARRRGARPEKFEQAKNAMRNDIQQGRLTVAQLENMLEKNLATRYGVSRDTARKARKAVLSELNSRQIPTNDK